MSTAGAHALSITDVAFFTPPPNRPSRPERRTGGDGVVTTLLRTIRRELAHAAETTDTEGMPRVTK
ncbi:MAG: hypothetical protein ACRDG7_19075 [Candidatus Limnocylindria bacterium]